MFHEVKSLSERMAQAASHVQDHTDPLFMLGVLGLVGGFIFARRAWFFGERLLANYDAEVGGLPHRWVEWE